MARLPGLLLLTHSSRRTNPARSSVDFLSRRFGDPARLENLPPLTSLGPPKPLYSGALSIFRVSTGARLELVGLLRHRDKIQHAVAAGPRELWVGFEHRLELWRLPAPAGELHRLRRRDVTVERRLEHPHLAGLHTVELLGAGRLAVACSASDSVLVLDAETGTLERTLRMPEELYGRGYELGPDHDLRRHYVDDEQQTTHLNAAWPTGGGRHIVVSTLIQGAVGRFDLESGGYEELTRGFVGCHGARVNDRGEVCFADSTTGALVVLDGDGRIARRFAAPSRWLHDVCQVAGGVYAFALADANELRLYDVEAGVLLDRRRFFTWPVDAAFPVARRLPFWAGNSVQALSYQSSSALSP